MARYDLLVAGEINPDLILSGLNITPQFGQVETLVNRADLTVGSSSVIFACGAARLGLRVGFLGVVGDDLFGRFMLDEMASRGIDISGVAVDPALDTGFSVILNRGQDRAILTYAGAMSALTPDRLTDVLLQQSRHLHLSSFFLQTRLRPAVAGLFERARSFGLTTSLDINWDPAGAWEGVEAVLEHTLVFFPNRAEGEALTGKKEVSQILVELSGKAPVVAMKLGPEGAAARKGDETVQVRAPKVKVVDTVGAGDSFDAGFIYGFLQGWPLQRCLEMAVVCGSLSTRAAGGVDGQPTLPQAIKGIETLHDRK